jgi:dihydrofolate reductase
MAKEGTMPKTYLFMMVSLDGFFEGPDHSLDWHNVDQEFVPFAIRQLDDTGVILFGRRTYEMMAAFWPSEAAVASDPETAKRMNGAPKVVFSNSLREARWQNTRLAPGDLLRETVEALRQKEQKDIAVFGSSDLAVSLLRLGLLDELRIMVNPVVLGAGKRLFEGIDRPLDLRLYAAQTFTSGNVLLRYRPKS